MELSNSLYIIQKLKQELFLSDRFVMDSLELTSDEYHSIKHRPQKIESLDINLLTDRLGEDVCNILNGDVNWNSLRSKWADKESEIDPYYTIGAGTYMDSIRAIIQHIDNVYNNKTAKYIMSHFGLTDKILIDDSRKVNILMANEIFELLKKENLIDQNDISLMTIACLSGKIELLSSLRRKHLSGREIAKHIATNSDKYEKNYSYKFKDLDSKHYMISSISREEMNELFHTSELSSELLNIWKKEIISHTALMAKGSGIEIIDIENKVTNTYQETNYIIKDNLSSLYH